MDETQKQDEQTHAEENFAELLEQSLQTPERLRPGDRVEAEIVQVTPEWVFLDLGGKSEGCIPAAELCDERGAITVKPGDRVTAWFLSDENNQKLFSVRLGTGPAALRHLEEACAAGVPIEGAITAQNKGGFEVRIAGGVRAFCPHSQMGLRRVADPEALVGERVSFLVIEYGQGGRRIVLSNRAVLEAERREQREALQRELTEGMRVRGTVTSLRDFGAFVDLGGVEALVPISEISWSRVERPADVLQVGQEVQVQVLSLDWERDRISCSLKAVLPDPWESAAAAFPEGSTQRGRVVRLTGFGAFVELCPGVDGLVHISRLGGGRRLSHPGEVVSVGDTLEVTVEQIDSARRRIALAPAPTAAQQQDAREEEETRKAFVSQSRPGSLGTLGDLIRARRSGKH